MNGTKSTAEAADALRKQGVVEERSIGIEAQRKLSVDRMEVMMRT